MPLGSLHGPPGSVPQCTVPDSSDSELTSSMMSISPFSGHWPGPEHPERRPVAKAAGRLLDRGGDLQLAARRGADVGAGGLDAAGGPRAAAADSRDVEVAVRRRGARCWSSWSSSRSRRCRSSSPARCRTSTGSPMPDPDAPLKSSLKTVDQPDGGPGTAAGAAATAGPRPLPGRREPRRSGAVAAASAITGAMMASASPPRGRHLVARSTIRMTRLRYARHARPPYPLQGFK